VLCLAGDDHGAKSSTVPHQSDHAFISALMPYLYPSSIHEMIEMGLLGIAMSRYSGCWVGMKVITETVETTAEIDLTDEMTPFVIPADFEMPPGGLNLRWPDDRYQQDLRLQDYKGFAAIAFARANKINRITMDSPNARYGIMASGKSYEDIRQALRELGITEEVAAKIGLRLYKIGMPWPLEPEGVRQFAVGLEEIFIIEERREIVEGLAHVEIGLAGGDDADARLGAVEHDLVELVGAGEGEGGIELVFVQAELLLERRVRPADVEAARRHLEIGREDEADARRIDEDRSGAVDRLGDRLQGDPAARIARHRPAIEAEIEDVLDPGRVEHRDRGVHEGVFGLVRQR